MTASATLIKRLLENCNVSYITDSCNEYYSIDGKMDGVSIFSVTINANDYEQLHSPELWQKHKSELMRVRLVKMLFNEVVKRFNFLKTIKTINHGNT